MVGTPGKPVTLSSTIELQDLRREGERALEHQPRARAERHDHLVEAVVEGERQDAEDDVVLASSEVGRDRGAAVSMLRCVSITPLGSPVDPEV